MSLKSLFKAVVAELKKREIPFAVAGGFAADLYRREPRLTMDVDVVIMVDKRGTETAAEILRHIGLKPGVVRTADLAGGPMFAIKRKSTKPCMVVGRKDGNAHGEGVDLLLPELPWVEQAVYRAQINPVDYGFGSIPTLTIEDVIIAKLYALQHPDIRAKDLDDLQSIFAAGHEMNLPYISGQMSRLELQIPRRVKTLVPEPILILDKGLRRSRNEMR